MAAPCTKHPFPVCIQQDFVDCIHIHVGLCVVLFLRKVMLIALIVTTLGISLVFVSLSLSFLRKYYSSTRVSSSSSFVVGDWFSRVVQYMYIVCQNEEEEEERQMSIC